MVYCEDCIYWKRLEGHKHYGTCHKYAPRPIVIAQPATYQEQPLLLVKAFAPETSGVWGCGEGETAKKETIA